MSHTMTHILLIKFYIITGRRDCVYWDEVKKTLITVCEALINLFNLIVSRGRPRCIEKIRAVH